MDAKLIEPRANVPFSQYMEDDNLPSNSDGASPGSGIPSPVHNRPDGINNGRVDYPLPPDPNTERPDKNTILDMGLRTADVGHNGSAHSYGLAKGEVKQGPVDDSVAGQGFGD